MKQYYPFTAATICLLLLSTSQQSIAETSNDQRYLNYNTAIAQMSSNVDSRREAMRTRFQFDPELFDSKKVAKITRRTLPPPNFYQHDGANFSSTYKKPTTSGNVLTQPTGNTSGGRGSYWDDQ